MLTCIRSASGLLRLNTLRVKFGLWTVGLLLVALISAGVLVYMALARSLSNSIDNALRLNASQTLAALEIEDGGLDISQGLLESAETAGLQSGEFVLRVLNADGQLLQVFGSSQSLPILPASVAAARAAGTDLTTVRDPGSEEAYRVHTVAIEDGGQVTGYYQVGQSLDDTQDTLGRLASALLIGIPAAALIAGLGGYLLAARALGPIDVMTRTAYQISAEDLSARLPPPPTDDEVGRLALTFNEMLGRLDRAFQRERQFIADASHELRTPLAAMQAILDVTGEKARASATYRMALADLAEEVARLRRLAENLLLLAQTNGQRLQPQKTVHLSLLLEDVVESLAPLAAEKGLAVLCRVPPGIHLAGDMDGLIRLFANLLDNAIKYTDRGEISVAARAGANGVVEVAVEDTGIGIDATQLPHIFERFYRSDQSRNADGFGLGLAIARTIAEEHGGSVDVQSEVGTGTRMIVRLPHPVPDNNP